MSELMLRFLRLSLGQLHPFVVVCTSCKEQVILRGQPLLYVACMIVLFYVGLFWQHFVTLSHRCLLRETAERLYSNLRINSKGKTKT